MFGAITASDGVIFSLSAISLHQRGELGSSLAITVRRVHHRHHPWSLTPPILTVCQVRHFDLGKDFHVLHFGFEF
ncbi:hypothetical protein FH972_017732 [Carpinus fangiana]|uniref:Uncharacterized protein n=1 Tax=Carpinus fangiana TaxID=176857 RepID=A0A5N6RKB5_9ROSI|nr:hypothetical protein FH972_017732 [Carpinus fangiana]